MKLNFWKSIVGCVLVALMSFAAGKTSASSVIGEQLYTPMNIKVVLSYYDGAGKLKKTTVSTKDILLVLGYAKNAKLTRGPGGDIYVTDKNTVLADLTADGYLSMDFNQTHYTQTSKGTDSNASFNYQESGLLDVNFYSDGGEDESGGQASLYWFEVSGSYTGSGQVSSVKNNEQTVKENLKSSDLSGNGFDIDLYEVNSANGVSLVTGDVSGNGSGKVLASE